MYCISMRYSGARQIESNRQVYLIGPKSKWFLDNHFDFSSSSASDGVATLSCVKINNGVLVTHMCVSLMGLLLFRQLCHYLKQPSADLLSFFSLSRFFPANAFENVICKSRPFRTGSILKWFNFRYYALTRANLIYVFRINVFHFSSAISACICLLSGVSTRPTDRLTTETTVNENATFLDNTTSVTNYNGSVEVAAQDDSNLTTTDKIRLPTTTGTFSNVTHSADLDSTTARIYPGSSQGSVDISQSDVTEATDTEPPETTTSDVSQQVHVMVNRTISLEVPMGNTGSHSTNSADEHTDNGWHRRSDYKVVLRINLTVNETDIGGYVNLEGPVRHSWVEDHEPNTDTTSAGTAAVTTGSPSPSPTPVTIAAESMAEVRMCLTDARHKASDALESYVSRRKSELNWWDYTKR